MRIAGIIKNDFVNGQDVCVSLWTQGCPHCCKGCHNQHTWDPNGGEEWDIHELTKYLSTLLTKNGINRNLSILGGEPLAPYNKYDVFEIVYELKQMFPDMKIFLWTGYTLEELEEDCVSRIIISYCDMLVEGRFILEQRDVTLPFSGSPNQRVLFKDVIQRWLKGVDNK